ncbi:MAG TPA: cation-translocating P-type ATPase [Propionibacteriaceae bacterium]|nr:cation-translocating P-type ATPase [Propionibacteriaceae bacterium]
MTQRPWHTLPVDQVLAELGSTPQGLSEAEAAARLETHGHNELRAAGGLSPWRILLEQLKNVLIVILLVATGISFALGEAVESLVIAVIVLFAVVLGFVQEYRAERAIDALRELAAPMATVTRDGREEAVAARTLVPGDVIVLASGDRVAADGRLIESANLAADEGPLTGESQAVEKRAATLGAAELAVGDRTNMVHAGTAITYGRGRAVVVATGMDTEVGNIAQLLQTVETGRTPLQQNLDRVGKVLARAAIILVVLVAGLGILRGQPAMDMLLFAIALAVAVVPEALPAVVTISLAIGVRRMVKRNALLRRLHAVETLGSTSVICSDKTGTLTKDEMTVRRVVVGGEVIEVTGSGYEPQGQFRTPDGREVEGGLRRSLSDLLTAAALASDAQLTGGDQGSWAVTGDPTEGALVVAARKAGLDKAALERDHPRIDEIPFTSETKRMTTLHEHGGGVLAFTKGAPEVVVPSCTAVLGAEGLASLDELGRREVLDVAGDFAAHALRVLAVAAKRNPEAGGAQEGLTLLGLVGMIDPPRTEAADAIARCRDAGIRPVMITGDHPATAQAVARELGLLPGGSVVVGSQVDAMTDDELFRQADSIAVYARVSPEHKLRVVTALQRRGHVVAMTGDGVNDAPALKKADIGVAMGITGTDVSKEAAAMTLTDDNFASIVAAIEEGRAVFDNVKKYLMYLLSANIGEIGLMVVTMLLGLPLPLSAVQILYVNLATDGLPALALAVDPAEPDLMKRPPRNPTSGVFTRPVVRLMVAGGAWSAVLNTSLFAWALQSGRGVDHAMAMTFVCLVMVEFIKAFALRSERISSFVRPFANRWLNLAVLWETALLLTILYVPFLERAFGTVALTFTEWAALLGAATTIVPVLELVKWLNRRGTFDRAAGMARHTGPGIPPAPVRS